MIVKVYLKNWFSLVWEPKKINLLFLKISIEDLSDSWYSGWLLSTIHILDIYTKSERKKEIRLKSIILAFFLLTI